jgi:hypothetical protein
MTGGWGKLFNKELHKLYSLPDVLGQWNQGGWDGHIQCTFKRYAILGAEPEGKRILWRPSHRSENNIRMDLDK